MTQQSYRLHYISVARPDQVAEQFAREDVLIDVVTVGMDVGEGNMPQTRIYCRDAAVWTLVVANLQNVQPEVTCIWNQDSDVEDTRLVIAFCDEEALDARGFVDITVEDVDDLHRAHIVSPLRPFGHPDS